MIYALVLPLAVLLGFMMADPNSRQTWAILMLVLLVISAPLLHEWHFPLLLLTWNMNAVAFIFPGRPKFWLLFAGMSFLIAIFRRSLGFSRFPAVGSVTVPALFLGAVVLLTAQLRGGIGLNAFGSGTVGGGRYLLVLGSILGLFAFVGNQIPEGKRLWAVRLFFLGALLNTISILAPYAPEWSYFIFGIFPVTGNDLGFLAADDVFKDRGIMRFYGLSVSAEALFCYLLARHGLNKILTPRGIFYAIMLLGTVVIGSLGGFRTLIISMSLIFVSMFLLEGLHRTRQLALMTAMVILFAVALVPAARHLPMSMQRAISFLPYEVSPIAKADATYSSEWRMGMWKSVLPLVPEYLWLGKGLAMNPQELHLMSELVRQGRVGSEEMSLYAGDYHNGPLTTIVPFGIWGVISLGWFMIAGGRALYRNWKYSDESLKKFNTLLFGLYVSKSVFFWVVFGNFYSDVAIFTGLIGFSISLNHGIRSRAAVQVEQSEPQVSPALPQPALARSI